MELLALSKTRMDVFPPLNEPRIYVFLQFGGMSPSQMEGLFVNQFDLLFQYVDGVKQIESKSIQQVALLELSFFPGTDMGAAEAQVVAMANRAMSRMPPGTLPPMVMRMDEGTVPAGYLVFRSETTPLGRVADYAQNVVRPLVQANVPGTVAVSPFGPNVRTILIKVDPDKLQTYNSSPQDVVNALMSGNAVIPAGNLYVKDQMPLVPTNALAADIRTMGAIPLKLGSNVYIRDVATITDGTDVDYGYALVDGKKAVFLPIIKKDTASTLTVVSDIRRSMPIFREAVPKDVTVEFAFDESPTVVNAIRSVATEGLLGAGLTGLMILLFLRDLRSVVVVVLNIPLALMGSLFGLYATGNTINIMSLGGMALAIGMLVDMAIVSIENTHVQMTTTNSLARAVERGRVQTDVPRLLAMLCVLAVFIPAFIMRDPIRAAIHAPGAGRRLRNDRFLLALQYARACHSRLDPEVSWRPRTRPNSGIVRPHPDPIRASRGDAHPTPLRSRLGVFGRVRCCLWRPGTRLGTELFPQVDSGEFVLRYRPPRGSNFEITRQMGVKILQEIGKEAGAENIEVSLGYAGQIAPNFGMNNMVLFMRGPDDGWITAQVPRRQRHKSLSIPRTLAQSPTGARRALDGRTPGEARRREGHRAAARRDLPVQLRAGRHRQRGDELLARRPRSRSLSPAPTCPIARAHATKILNEMKRIPFLRDVQFQETLDYPTVEVQIDREKAGLSGVTAQQVGNDDDRGDTSSSRFVALNYWQNVKTGFDYQVEVLVPPQIMTSAGQVERLPLTEVNPLTNLMVRDVAQVREGTMLGQYNRLASQRYLSITANVEGEDMGRAARQVSAAVAAAGEPPRGVQRHRSRRAKSSPWIEMFESLAIGLAIAVGVILVMLTAYFESPRLAIVSVSAVPGVLAERRGHPALHPHDSQHRIVHGHDHVHRRVGLQLGDAGEALHRTMHWRGGMLAFRCGGSQTPPTACGRS